MEGMKRLIYLWMLLTYIEALFGYGTIISTNSGKGDSNP
jgi:hypothetical protein